MRHAGRGLPGFLAILSASALLSAAGPAKAQEGTDEPEGWQFGPSLRITNRGADFELRVNSYVQGDVRSRRNFTDGDDEEPGLNGSEWLVRSTRIGLEGEWHRFRFQAMADPQDEGDELKDLWGEIRIAKALSIRGGHVKVPFSGEFMTSFARIDFMERAMIATHLVPSRDWGVMALGEPFKRFDYMIGIFEGDGRTQRTRADRTVSARVAYAAHRTLDLGASFSEGEVTADGEVEGVEPEPRGSSGLGASQHRFYDPHFVAGRRRRLGADARWSLGPVALRGEWLRATEEREGQGPVFDDLPAQIGEGWVASATWLVTGEKKSRTIKPDRPLSKGGPGAIEVGARIESLRFDDAEGDVGFAGSGNRARNIRPAADRALTGGLSWWPESWIRLMGNVVLEHYEDALLAPEPGRQGQYVTILGRLRLQLP